jgi:uncharacterized membrane protein
MPMKISHPFWQVIGIGALAGMRTSAAPVIASHILSRHHSIRFARSPLNFMQSKKVAGVLKFAALGELVVDKLPTTPNRIKPEGIAFRCLSGALAGAGIYKATGANTAAGALMGAAAAFASTYVSYLLRKNLVKNSGIIDPVIGAFEDALVIGTGIALVKIA